jgi:hypothetical protein
MTYFDYDLIKKQSVWQISQIYWEKGNDNFKFMSKEILWIWTSSNNVLF